MTAHDLYTVATGVFFGLAGLAAAAIVGASLASAWPRIREMLRG